MDRHRLIIQMAFATDHTGSNLQGAAREAMRRALVQADLPVLATVDVPAEEIETRVTLGVPDLSALDEQALRAELPAVGARLVCVKGGQTVVDPVTGARLFAVTAAAEVFLPCQGGWRLRRRAGPDQNVASPSEAP